MNAKTQYKLTSSDLDVLLALARAGTLAQAGEKLGLDASTVFRTVQRIEKGIGQRLFERGRAGYQASELSQELARLAEQIEVHLDEARAMTQSEPEQVAGAVRITTTDTILHGLVAPQLKLLQRQHPLLSFDLHAGNELANLTRRDADIAIRATKKPPLHLVGKPVGPIRVAVFAAANSGLTAFDATVASTHDWVAPDEALPDHPSVVWRKKNFPKINPTFRVNSILTAAEFIGQGLAIGVLPLFLASGRADLQQISEVIDECQTELWLLTHPESRHLRRVATVFSHLSQGLVLR